MKLIPLTKHAVIRVCKTVLKKQAEITEDDVISLKNIIQSHLDSGLTPAQIRDLYQLQYSDFGMFIKKSLQMTIKTHQEALVNYCKKAGKAMSEPKAKYKMACQFKFDPYSAKDIPGHALLLEHGLYHAVLNPSGVCRDHMVSVEYGWRNNIPAALISSPYNCQFISNNENITKGASCCLTVDQLVERISSGAFAFTKNVLISLPKTESHKKKISETNKQYMNITNGSINRRVLKTTEIPVGFRQGLTRKSKLVGQPGFEPGSEIF